MKKPRPLPAGPVGFASDRIQPNNSKQAPPAVVLVVVVFFVANADMPLLLPGARAKVKMAARE